MTEKLFVGAKVRRLRDTRQWTLEACAARLGLSASYLSQIETNQRPVTARVLIALTQAFQVDAGMFDASDEGRLAADLREATLESAAFANPPTATEVKQAAKLTPGLAQQFLALHSAFRRLNDRVKAMDEAISLDEGARASASLPYEEVRDFFHDKDNYIDELDHAAEALSSTLGLPPISALGAALEAALTSRRGVGVSRVRIGEHGLLRRYDPRSKTLQVNGMLPTPSQDFQLAYQLASLEFAELIETELERANFRTLAARDICRVGLTNYAAGALLMPYTRFAEAAAEMRHDVEQMCALFQTSFEQTCHRLSTLQRRGHRGLPFYFVRVDLAGNISSPGSAEPARYGTSTTPSPGPAKSWSRWRRCRTASATCAWREAN
jgi:transcriptional regulator with XRE-family HTH domain